MTNWKKYMFMVIFVRVYWVRKIFMKTLSSYVWIFIIKWFRRIHNWKDWLNIILEVNNMTFISSICMTLLRYWLRSSSWRSRETRRTRISSKISSKISSNKNRLTFYSNKLIIQLSFNSSSSSSSSRSNNNNKVVDWFLERRKF